MPILYPGGNVNDPWGQWIATTTSTTTSANATSAWVSWNTTATTWRPVTARTQARSDQPPWRASDPCEECGMGTAGPMSHRDDCSVTIERQRALEALRVDRERQRIERDRADAERRTWREEANERAEQMLEVVLTAAELAEWRQWSRLVITGSDGRRYQIREGTMGNVAQLDDEGEDYVWWCAHPSFTDHDGRELPVRDLHVGQIVALKTDADAFRTRANLHWESRAAVTDRLERRRLREAEVAARPRLRGGGVLAA